MRILSMMAVVSRLLVKGSVSLHFVLCLFVCLMTAIQMEAKHKNFKVSVYVRANEVDKMKDTKWLESSWATISSQLDVDKIYLETHRDMLLVDDGTIEKAKAFFQKQGIEVAGGITYTVNESNEFETFCYSDPEHRKIVKRIAETTAKHFDEFLLDDFFFTSCKSPVEIAAKGDMTWTEYRLKLMNDAAKNLVIGPAKAVNPKVKVIIKYPNWYDHFQGLGFNLEDGPRLFDGIWTGTETRNPDGDQHLQNYLSYQIIRYFENLRPGYNGGGWVDAGGIQMSMDRYAEQLHLTAIAKARDVMLFAYNQLLEIPLLDNFRAPWQGTGTSWNYDEMRAPYKNGNQTVTPTTMARIADVALRQADELVGKLGNPVGIQSYKPFHALGEDFLQNYLGMIGLPMDVYPSFPKGQNVVLLTEQAAGDPGIMDKIKQQLLGGHDVVITSGLLKAIPKKIAQVCELRCSDLKAIVNDFGRYGKSSREMIIPQVLYQTNDSWEVVSAGRPLKGGVSGFPILHKAKYADAYLYVLTIPDDKGNLYDYPSLALNEIRRVMSQDMDFYLEGPSKVCLFMYDNHTLIVENFNDEPVDVKLVGVTDGFKKLTSLQDSSTIDGKAEAVWIGWKKSDKTKFALSLKPHSYQAFRYE